MNKIRFAFAYPLLLFKSATSGFKKIKLDGFVGGLIFGAIFSLLVNVITVKIQETITGQRYLEALENDILQNGLTANNTINENDTSISKKELPSPFHGGQRYSTRVWDHSEILQYVSDLDPKVQAQLFAYFGLIISNNNMLNRNEQFFDNKLSNCYISTQSNPISNDCKSYYLQYLSDEEQSATQVSKYTVDMLTVFHPTRDRLNNWFLRLIMGDNAVGALKVPPRPAASP